MARTEREVAHLALDPAKIVAIAAGDDAFLEYFAKHRLIITLKL